MYYYLCQVINIKYSTMRYTYNIVDVRDSIIETNLGTEDEAYEIMSMMQSQGIDTSGYRIIEIQHYTVKGLGRDPDLH